MNTTTRKFNLSHMFACLFVYVYLSRTLVSQFFGLFPTHPQSLSLVPCLFHSFFALFRKRAHKSHKYIGWCCSKYKTYKFILFE